MPTVTGDISYIGGQVTPTGVTPEIIFTPSKPTITTAGAVIYTHPVTARPASSTNGFFSVELLDTSRSIDEDFYYQIKLRWNKRDAYGGDGLTEIDFLDMRLYVPSVGGRIDDLVTTTSPSSTMWWVSEEPPEQRTSNIFWLRPSTGDVKRWE